MRKLVGSLLMTVLLGFIVLWAGCLGRGAEGDNPQPPPHVEPAGTPDWFLEIPGDPDSLYAHATGDSRNYQFALDAAKQQGTLDIAGQVTTKISGMFKRFREEVGMGEDAELRATTTAASKSLVSEIISGCRTVKNEVRQEGTKYRAFVRMQMSVNVIKTALVSKIKQNGDMYTQFRASEGFKELEAEVQKD